MQEIPRRARPSERVLAVLSGPALALALTFSLALALGATPLAQNDKVVLKNGKDKTVRIKSEDFDGLWHVLPGGAGNAVIHWNEIDSIQYTSADAYQKALESLNAGRFAEGAGQLTTLAADAELRPVLKQNVLFHLAMASARLGKPDEALARYKELLGAFPKSRYLLPAGSSLLAIHMAKNDAAGAARLLEPILASAEGTGSDSPFKAALGILRGRVLEAQDKTDNAVSLYEGTLRIKDIEPDVLNAAKLGLARCAQKKGNAIDAEKRYRELSVADAPNALLAGAWNGLGDLALQQATERRDPDGLVIALLSYLRGVVLYVPDVGEPSDELERALAGAARSAQAIGELEGNKERKQLFLERARQYRSELRSKYPSSRFLQGLPGN